MGHSSFSKKKQHFLQLINGIPPEKILFSPIDVSKHFHGTLLHDIHCQPLSDFFQFSASKLGFASFITRLEELCSRHSPQLVFIGMEPTSVYYEALLHCSGVLTSFLYMTDFEIAISCGWVYDVFAWRALKFPRKFEQAFYFNTSYDHNKLGPLPREIRQITVGCCYPTALLHNLNQRYAASTAPNIQLCILDPAAVKDNRHQHSLRCQKSDQIDTAAIGELLTRGLYTPAHFSSPQAILIKELSRSLNDHRRQMLALWNRLLTRPRPRLPQSLTRLSRRKALCEATTGEQALR